MKTLALAVLLSIVQAASPVLRKAADSATSSGSNITSNSKSHQTPTHALSTAPEHTESAQARPESHDPFSAATKKAVVIREPASVPPTEPDWWYRFYVIFTGLLVAIGAIGVGCAVRTLQAIERQVGIMERQMNKERARIRIDLKPLLRLQEPDSGEGETVQIINYTVTFYGSTYAFVDEDAFDAWLSDSPKPDERRFGHIGDGPSSVISPGAAPNDRIETVDTTRFEVDSLMHGKSFLHFKGWIKYRDFAEVKRETTIYCVWKSFGPRKGHPPSILGGSGRWEKAGPPEANHET
jgi:hypothetical protein